MYGSCRMVDREHGVKPYAVLLGHVEQYTLYLSSSGDTRFNCWADHTRPRALHTPTATVSPRLAAMIPELSEPSAHYQSLCKY